jgi:hypothetical protein
MVGRSKREPWRRQRFNVYGSPSHPRGADRERSIGEGEMVSTAGGERDGVTARVPLVRLDGLRVLVVDDEADARRAWSWCWNKWAPS